MSELQRDRKESDWSDQDRENYSDVSESTYRDGSFRNECWNPDAYGSKYRENTEDYD